ncbi:hypothetical protein QZM22_27680 [Burkholderia oklahomensis]|uniref:hypothetical protein n=1 Tax=Burkholderia oklahomensis TaxID=342113 RepID=UPI00264CAA3F|nr:hypothetical protein [Burkholderia oklahomensis]MDN7676174.1 hypothetical protein [Burkholderia oklahomensis]
MPPYIGRVAKSIARAAIVPVGLEAIEFELACFIGMSNSVWQSKSRNAPVFRCVDARHAMRAMLRSLDIRHFFVVVRARLPLSLRTTRTIACRESSVAAHNEIWRLASSRHRGAVNTVEPAACAANGPVRRNASARAASRPMRGPARGRSAMARHAAIVSGLRILRAGSTSFGRAPRRAARMRGRADARPSMPAAAREFRQFALPIRSCI